MGNSMFALSMPLYGAQVLCSYFGKEDFFLLHCTAALDLWSFVSRSLGFIGIIRQGC